MACIAPGDIVLVNPTAQLIGFLAEDHIQEAYLANFGRSPGSFFPKSSTDMKDTSRKMHKDFLEKNNPSKLPLAVDPLNMRIPDLLTHDPSGSVSPSRAEFYEIKPNSSDGRRHGFDKIADLVRDYGKQKVPYITGIVWKPWKKERAFKGEVFGIEVECYFHYFLFTDGLVVYQFCLEGKVISWLKLAMIIAILAAILIIIINRGRIPDIPPPKPPELPLPKPVPIPVPVPPVPVPVPRLEIPIRGGGPAFIPASLSEYLPQRPPLSASVGYGGVNRARDVMLVQSLLNDWLGNVDQPLLKVDGIVGPLTTSRILAFQQTYTPFRDGFISPTGPTLSALLCQHLGSILRGVQSPFGYRSAQATMAAATMGSANVFEDYYAALAGNHVSGYPITR